MSSEQVKRVPRATVRTEVIECVRSKMKMPIAGKCIPPWHSGVSGPRIGSSAVSLRTAGAAETESFLAPSIQREAVAGQEPPGLILRRPYRPMSWSYDLCFTATNTWMARGSPFPVSAIPRR